MKIIIIANIKSGGNRGNVVLKELQKACIEQKYAYEVYISEYIGHVRSIIQKVIAKNADHDDCRIVIIGGDGTLNDAISGLKLAHIAIPVAYLPAGTGNDFAREFNITYQPVEFLKKLTKATVTELEILQFQNNESQEVKYGLNSIGFGFDALVAYLTNNASSKGMLNKIGVGKLSYLSQLVTSYKNHQTFSATIRNETGQLFEFDEILLCTFMNHSFFGGGIRLDPASASNNHQIGLVLAHHVSKRLLLKILPHILFTGKQFEKTDHLLRIAGTAFDVQLSNTYYMQTDGEASVPETLNFSISLTTTLFWKTF